MSWDIWASPWVVLGRVRGSSLDGAAADAPPESVMDPGPSTARPNTQARELVSRLAERNLKTVIVTTPEGCLIGVFHRADAERQLGEARPRRT